MFPVFRFAEPATLNSTGDFPTIVVAFIKNLF